MAGTETTKPEWLEELNGKEGVYCTTCNSVFYLNEKQAIKLSANGCPICGGIIMYIIKGSNYQPLEG